MGYNAQSIVIGILCHSGPKNESLHNVISTGEIV
jgi:hypothetical protein